jgi:hypothetical protein
MPLLELELNCLCLYARDTGENGDEHIVHVLMPRSDGHGEHAGHDKHVVRMFHKDINEEKDGKSERETGRSIEGWALVLGQGKSSANLTLKPEEQGSEAEIPDLDELFGATLDRALIADAPNDKVAARITLRAGKVTGLFSERNFKLGERTIALAHRVIWTMNGVPHELDWRRLHATEPDVPLASLESLTAEDDDEGGYRLEIHAVTENALPPGKAPTLSAADIKRHYAMVLSLLDIQEPGDEMLPEITGPGVDGSHCVGGGTKVVPPATG